MAEERLEIILDAQTQQATKAIADFAKTVGVELNGAISVYEAFDKKIKETQTALKQASDPAAVVKLTNELKNLQTGFNQIKAGELGKGFNSVKQGANQAGNAVLNFGRIAQDSSFGILGVANNIEPFIQSLGSLKQAAGGGGSAIKAFFGALAGPAGIGVLIGAISLFDAYSNGYGIFAGRAKKATDEQKKFNDELDQARAGAAKTGAQLQALIAITQDANQTETVRANALKQINETTSQYGINITKATIATGEAATAVNELTKALIAQAVAAKLADKLAELIIKQGNAIKVYSDAKKELDSTKPLAQSLGNVQSVAGGFAAAGTQIAGAGDALGKYSDAVRKTATASTDYKNVTAELQTVSSLLNVETAKGLALVKSKTLADKSGTAATKETTTALSAEAAERQRLAAIAQAEMDRIDQLTAKKRLANVAAVTAAPANTGAGQAGAINRGLDPGILKAQADAASQAASQTEAFAIASANAATANQLLSPAIDSVFAALQSDDPFGTLLDGLKQFVIGLIKAVAQALILQAILAAFSGGASAAGGAGGFLGKLGGLLGFRANGGPVGAGSPYIVGESGPELFVPQTAGSVVPNMALSGGGTLSATVSGNDLLFILNQAGSNRRNNFG